VFDTLNTNTYTKYKLWIICGSYIREFSVSKGMIYIHIYIYIYIYINKGGGSKEGSNTFMSNTNCQRS
jgi:hypothetical protein